MKMLTLICCNRTESSEDVVVTSTKSSLLVLLLLKSSTKCQGFIARFILNVKDLLELVIPRIG